MLRLSRFVVGTPSRVGNKTEKCSFSAFKQLNAKECASSMMREEIMNQQVFVPVTDDMIYNHPEVISGPLITYEAGMECHEWLSIELNPEDDSDIERIVKKRARESVGKAVRAKPSPNLSLVLGSAIKGC